MDSTALVAGATAGLVLAGAWLDLRRRTNGKGPIAEAVNQLAGKIDAAGDRFARLEDRQARADQRLGRIEEHLVEGSLVDRAEEAAVHDRQDVMAASQERIEQHLNP
jgi:uncharacterized membrane protein YccC